MTATCRLDGSSQQQQVSSQDGPQEPALLKPCKGTGVFMPLSALQFRSKSGRSRQTRKSFEQARPVSAAERGPGEGRKGSPPTPATHRAARNDGPAEPLFGPARVTGSRCSSNRSSSNAQGVFAGAPSATRLHGPMQLGPEAPPPPLLPPHSSPLLPSPPSPPDGGRAATAAPAGNGNTAFAADPLMQQLRALLEEMGPQAAAMVAATAARVAAEPPASAVAVVARNPLARPASMPASLTNYLHLSPGCTALTILEDEPDHHHHHQQQQQQQLLGVLGNDMAAPRSWDGGSYLRSQAAAAAALQLLESSNCSSSSQPLQSSPSLPHPLQLASSGLCFAPGPEEAGGGSGSQPIDCRYLGRAGRAGPVAGQCQGLPGGSAPAQSLLRSSSSFHDGFLGGGGGCSPPGPALAAAGLLGSSCTVGGGGLAAASSSGCLPQLGSSSSNMALGSSPCWAAPGSSSYLSASSLLECSNSGGLPRLGSSTNMALSQRSSLADLNDLRSSLSFTSSISHPGDGGGGGNSGQLPTLCLPPAGPAAAAVAAVAAAQSMGYNAGGPAAAVGAGTGLGLEPCCYEQGGSLLALSELFKGGEMDTTAALAAALEQLGLPGMASAAVGGINSSGGNGASGTSGAAAAAAAASAAATSGTCLGASLTDFAAVTQAMTTPAGQGGMGLHSGSFATLGTTATSSSSSNSSSSSCLMNDGMGMTMVLPERVVNKQSGGLLGVLQPGPFTTATTAGGGGLGLGGAAEHSGAVLQRYSSCSVGSLGALVPGPASVSLPELVPAGSFTPGLQVLGDSGAQPRHFGAIGSL